MGNHKDKEDPTRWILQRGDYKRDLHRAGTGYFFTIRFLPSVPKASYIEPKTKMPKLYPVGALLSEELFALEASQKGRIQVETYAIMEDHLHVCLWVKETTPQTPLQLLTKMMMYTERAARERFGIQKLWAVPGTLYVCYSTAMYHQKKRYTLGNSTRWHMELEHPECAHPHPLAHPKLDDRYQWEGYGNETLLDGVCFLPCYITHTATEGEIALFTRLAIRLAQEGWTLVGGFVSPRERKLLQDVQATCNPTVIHLAATRLQDQKLPAQLASTLYLQFFLRLTSAEEQTDCERPLCVWQNLWAETFCGDWRQQVMDVFEPSATPEQQANLSRFLARWQSPKPEKYRGDRPLP